MITPDEMQRLLLGTGDVLGPDGKKIGSVGQVFLDARTGEPAWVTTVTGMFGSSESCVPLAGAVVRDDDVQVAYDKDLVRHAPRIDGADGALSPDDERELYRHYGLLADDAAHDEATHGAAPRGEDPRGDVAREDAAHGAGTRADAAGGSRMRRYPADHDGPRHAADGDDAPGRPAGERHGSARHAADASSREGGSDDSRADDSRADDSRAGDRGYDARDDGVRPASS